MVGRRHFNRQALQLLVGVIAATALATSRNFIGMRDILTRRGRTLTGTSAGHLAVVEEERCLGIMCGFCLGVCPTRAITIIDADGTVHAAMDDTLRGPRTVYTNGTPDWHANAYYPFSPEGTHTTAAIAPRSQDGLAGCIGCGLCVQACTVEAIHLEAR